MNIARFFNLSTILGTSALLLAACAKPVMQPAVTPEPPPPAREEAKPAEPPPPAPPPAEEPVKIPEPLTFAVGSDRLTAESDGALKHLAEYLAKKPQVTHFRIEGHTDSVGAKGSNQKLSEARALAVATWLVASGVDCKRLVPVGFGDSKPVADNATPEGRSQNRRTMFINAAVDGRALGGRPVDGGGVVAGDPCRR
jgi:OOP family OmpA-OmpF porin